MPARKKSAARTKRASPRKKTVRRKNAAARKKAASRAKAAPRGKRGGFRLARDVVPRAYDLWVEVDPSRDDRFQGEVSIDLSTDRPRRSLELHAVEIRSTRARVEFAGRTLRGRVVPNPARETISIELPESIPAGDATVRLR